MEGKAHSRRRYSPDGQSSRSERDLCSCCSPEPKSGTKPKAPTMIRHALHRSTTRWPPHVCVVGAGMAGLRCAEILIDRGVKVTVLEGRDRIGGRVHQSSQIGHSVDLGPNWIHGTDHNPILDLAKATNTAACSIGEGTYVFDELGKRMDEKKSKELSELVWGVIADAFVYSNDESVTIPPNRSLKDFMIEKLGTKEIGEVDRKMALQMAEMWGAFVGDPFEKQSLKFFWLEECIDGENLFVASTYKAILDRVAQAAVTKAEMRLSTKVSSIKTISTSSSDPQVLVTTDTHSFTFDEVVVTVPLGCLKHNAPSFSPPLPPRLIHAIQNISYGRLEKVYITFPTAFWDSPPPSPSRSTPLQFPFFSHFLHPTYARSNPSSWNVECVSLSSPFLFGPHAHPTLLFYIHGPCATHISNLLTLHPPSSPSHFQTLDSFFAPYYSLLPNFSPTASCQPLAILATNWQADALAGWGSYTNFQVTEDKDVRLDRDIEALRRGCPERGVWLAGEHTAPFVALGTVTGAWWSGEGVARRILEAYGLGAGEGGKEEVKVGKVNAGRVLGRDL